MTGRRLTKDLAEALPAGGVAWDGEIRGLGARRQRRDVSFILKYRDRTGRQRIFTIGRFGPGAWTVDRARKEAVRLLGLVRDGRDPAEARALERAAPAFSEFAARYLKEYAEPQKKRRTVEEDKRLLRLHILPAFGPIKVRDIDKASVARFHAAMRSTPVSANRAMALLSAILGWAERVGERADGTNPCRHVDRYPERGRERMLGADELARLGEAITRGSAEGLGVRASPEDWRAIAAIRLLVFTGARVSEILTMRWDWIDAARGVARLPDSKTGPKSLFLPPGALEVLAALPRYAANDYVLPGDRPGAHFIGLAKPWQRIRAAADLPDLRLHDLRHVFASSAVAAGDSLFIVGQLLGHRQASTTQKYAHLAPDPARAVADRTGERLRAQMTGARADIVPLRRG